MKKILDYILIFVLAFLVISFFQGKTNKKVQVQKAPIVINTKTSKYTVPASIKLNIENNSKKDLKLNICKDIKILFNNIEKKINDKSFCKNIEIKPNSKKTIDFDRYYKNFDKPWTYSFKVNVWDKQPLITTFNVDIRWFFWKLFTYFFYAPIYNLVVFFLKITWNSLFWAIVLVTILIRLLLLHPQHKTLKSQKQMQALQPKIKEVQEKHKWNHQMIWQETMKLYKEHWVNPLGSCWPMLIQMPILFVLYYVLMYIREESNIFYLYSFLKPFDVNQIQPIFYGIDLYDKGWTSWLVLAIIVATLQFLQIKFSMKNNWEENKTEKSKEIKKKDDNWIQSMMPDQKVMQKFMLIVFPLMIWVATYNFPAWLWIYWGITTLFMLIQQIFVNKIQKKSS